MAPLSYDAAEVSREVGRCARRPPEQQAAELPQSPNKPTIPQDKIRPLTSLDHPQSPFYDPEGGPIIPVARVVIERIARKVSHDGIRPPVASCWVVVRSPPHVEEQMKTRFSPACLELLQYGADSAFHLRPWLMTSMQIPESPQEYRYNMAHSATHTVMERTQQALCHRFRCLDGSRATLQYSPEKSAQIILACCILHNIALQHGLDIWLDPGPSSLETEEDCNNMEAMETEAYRMRQELIQNHFS